MKKIGLLTFHNAHNYGALLQCYALILKLNAFGECKVINYIRPNVNYSLISRYHGIKQKLMAIIKIYDLKKRADAIKKFMNAFPLSRKFTPVTIKNNSLKLDYIVTGSDQIWNCIHLDSVFFGDFPSSAKKVAYAASFGRSYIPEIHKENVRKLLDSYCYISVREKTASELIRQEYGIGAKVVLDPVFLLNKSQWRELEKVYNIKGKYMLVYLLEIGDGVKNLILTIKEKLRLPVYAITTIVNGKNYGADYNIIWLIDHAEYIVTSSFHGTAFSVIFEKNFTSIPKEDTSERMVDLLQDLGLQDRIRQASIDMMIDYKRVRERLEVRIKDSEQFLINALKEEL